MSAEVASKMWARQQMQSQWEFMTGLRDWRTPFAQPAASINIDVCERDIPYSEYTAAKRIVWLLEKRLTYVAGSKQWYFWNGTIHEHLASGRIIDDTVHAFVEEVARAMQEVGDWYKDEIAAAQRANNRQRAEQLQKDYKTNKFGKHRAYRDKLFTDRGQESLANQIRKMSVAEPGYFDDDRQWLVLRNGVIDLEQLKRDRYVTLLPHEASRPVSRVIDIDYDPTATHERWDGFLETSQPDEELRALLQRLVGAAFMGAPKVKAIPNLQGPKDCGKTVFISTLRALGGGYAEEPSPDALMEVNGQNWEQEKIRGKRFIAISEPSTTKKLDETFCKQVTGGDMVHTRQMRQESTGWLPQCVMFIASNDPVKLNTRDEAFLDRICLIKFPHRFWDEREAQPGEIHIKDYTLEKDLLNELQGIFNWVINGMLAFLERDIDMPDSVKNAARSLRTEGSSALRWMHERVEEGVLEIVNNVGDRPASHYALVGNLFTQYQISMALEGERNPFAKHAFTKELESELGPTQRSGGTRAARLVGVGPWREINISGWNVANV